MYIADAGDRYSIGVLNARATLKSDKKILMPKDVEDAWSDYVSQLKQNWGTSPIDNPRSDLGQAYNVFWEVYDRSDPGHNLFYPAHNRFRRANN
jgi:hypothetical protein